MKPKLEQHDPDFDVVIVGFGPVGQALVSFLGRAGHRVEVFERFPEIYRLPRAVHLDHEIMRLLQSLDLAQLLAEEMVPVSDYQWFGADGELLLRFDVEGPSRSGWATSYMFFQPELERAIDQHASAKPAITVEHGWLAQELVMSDASVELTLHRVTEDEPGRLAMTGDTRTVSAQWLLGADDANSFVREATGITRRDLGFRERWLVVDAEPHDMRALAHLPIASQRWPRRRRPHAARLEPPRLRGRAGRRDRCPLPPRTRGPGTGGDRRLTITNDLPVRDWQVRTPTMTIGQVV